jgi:hypothetical protein
MGSIEGHTKSGDELPGFLKRIQEHNRQHAEAVRLTDLQMPYWRRLLRHFGIRKYADEWWRYRN